MNTSTSQETKPESVPDLSVEALPSRMQSVEGWKKEVIESFKDASEKDVPLEQWAFHHAVFLVRSLAENAQVEYLVVDWKVQGEFNTSPSGAYIFTRHEPWDFFNKGERHA